MWSHANISVVGVSLLAVGAMAFLFQSKSEPVAYTAAAEFAASSTESLPPPFVATHLPTPSPVRALYMTSWVAGTKTVRDKVLKLIDTTEANAIVIDIKDYTGRIAFAVDDPKLAEAGSVEKRIPDIKGLIADLHSRGIYVIGRISSFQDRYLSEKRPELAVKSKKTGDVWRDRKGVSWLDEGNTEVWEYIVSIGREAYHDGFDELNFDYIRFPSDGDVKDMSWDSFNIASTTKPDQMKQFYAYLSSQLQGTGPVLSADLFGLVCSAEDDLGIGQVIENAAPYFDYIAPMVYPSHYASGFNNFKNPADHPYEVILSEMQSAEAKLTAASSTPTKLRPWLQDFDLGATYDAAMIRKEKKAVYDAGLDSWMIWSPSNNYTVGALDVDESQDPPIER